MGRPTNEQMLATLLETIRSEESLSGAKLESKLVPGWSAQTFESILESAIESGLVTRGPGGGGGVLRVTALSKSEADKQSQSQFMRELEKLTGGDYREGVKGESLRKNLVWSEAFFKSVRAVIQAQGRIVVRRGNGAYIYLAGTSTDAAAAKEISPAEGGQQPQEVKPDVDRVEQSLVSLNDADLAKLLAEVERCLDSRAVPTNREVRNRLGWGEYFFWQVRTQLVDEGRLIAENGPDGALKIPEQRSSFKNEPDVLVSRILRYLSSDGRDAVEISDLALRMSAVEELTVVACSRLLRMRFIQPIRGGNVMLADSLTLPIDAASDVLGVLGELKALNKPMVAKSTLLESLGWNKAQLANAIKECTSHQPPLVRDLQDIIATEPAAMDQYLADHDGEGGPSICRSPREFEDLRAALHQGKVVAFVGAGASMDAGLPTWKALLEKLITSLHGKDADAEKREILSLVARSSYIAAASAIERSIGALAFEHAVQRELAIDRCPYPSTAALVALNCIADKLRLIVTTNLDVLIDKTLGCSPTPMSSSAIQTSTEKVLHMHGVLDDPRTWVLTREQYNKVFYNDHHYFDALNSLFSGHTLMFVGYGMEDYEIDLILDRLEGSSPSSASASHYFFMEADEAERRPYFISRLKRLRMRPIFYQDHKNLPILLAKLAMP